MKNKFFSKKILIFIVLLFLLITFFFSHLINKTSNDPYKEFRNIDPNTSLVQLQDEYYVYFYKPSCKYCKEIQADVTKYAKNNNNIYFVNTEKYNIQKYDWKNFNSKNDIEIGTSKNGKTINFYSGESKEKYINNTKKNKYGKTIRYDIVIADDNYIKNNKNAKKGFVYASVQTPEIDYGSLSSKEKNSIIIAGVPTLLKIKNKKIIDFYFDSVEIKPLLKSLNND